MPEWLVPVVAALISTIGAVVSVVITRRAAREERLSVTEEFARKFREPLLQAASNLQGRIYNIIELNFFGNFLSADSADSEKEYAVLNTMHVFAQYFCWAEIVRRESQFLDPRNDRVNRAPALAMEATSEAFLDSINVPEKCFRFFRGEQRALGEMMMVPTGVSTPGAPRWECLGYASFVRSLEDEQMARWFRRLKEDIAEFAENPTARDGRLRLIHRRLMDFIEIVDPHAHSVSMQLRNRLNPPPS
ncbi:MAG TPA: hypothetical protein VJT72_01160 [Pseudonocardiaceae bacterium]|nr:hypothetical protein [Pseudonocardiaceae bacterium]